MDHKYLYIYSLISVPCFGLFTMLSNVIGILQEYTSIEDLTAVLEWYP
jgi:type III secretory pathway component EscS